MTRIQKIWWFLFGAILGILFLTFCIQMAAPAWAETSYVYPSAELHEEKTAYLSCVSTEDGPWRCHEDEYGIIQCEETYIFNNLVDDFEPSLIIDFDFNGPGGWKRGDPLPQFYVYENGESVLIPIIEVPDMNGDGTIDEQDKWLAKDAIEQYKTTKHHVRKINSMELPCYIKIEIKYID